MELTVLFSSAGTYFVSYASPDSEGDGGLAQWKWKDETETKILYSWEEIPVWNEDEYVEILELSSSKLKMVEDEEVYELQPTSSTKSAAIKAKNYVHYGEKKSGFLKNKY
jgi:hypothetical protein